MKTTENFLFKALFIVTIPLLFIGVYGFTATKPVSEPTIVRLPTVVVVGKRVPDQTNEKKLYANLNK